MDQATYCICSFLKVFPRVWRWSEIEYRVRGYSILCRLDQVIGSLIGLVDIKPWVGVSGGFWASTRQGGRQRGVACQWISAISFNMLSRGLQICTLSCRWCDVKHVKMYYCLFVYLLLDPSKKLYNHFMNSSYVHDYIKTIPIRHQDLTFSAIYEFTIWQS